MTVAPALSPNSPRPGTCRLAVDGVTKRFGGVTAVEDVSFDMEAGALLGVIGPNGAGKSTLLKLLSGTHQPSDGSIHFGDHHVDQMRPAEVARSGIALAHQIPRPFKGLTVWENVTIGAAACRHRHQIPTDDVVALVLDRCGLATKSRQRADGLRLLDLKRLELARALSTSPDLILLDEVAAGLSGRELTAVIDLISGIAETGTGLVLVEHVDGVVASLVDRVLVMEWGRVIADGTPAEVAADPKVREVYLGDSSHRPPTRRRTAQATGKPLLTLNGVQVRYGDITALNDMNMKVWPGEVVAVLGANGAGKSSLAAAISGAEPCRGGDVTFDNEPVTTQPAYQRARKGIAHCPEGRRIFVELSIEENLKLALPTRMKAADVRRHLDGVYAIFPMLHQMATRRAGSLSGGQQQMVAIGRALINKPRLVVLDEISLGLAPVVIDTLYQAIEQIRDTGIAVVIVEQNVHRCLTIADRVYVLDRGIVSYAGDPEPLNDPGVLERFYFGREQETTLTPHLEETKAVTTT